MRSIAPCPLKVESEFTDALLTGFGGWSALARQAERVGLLRELSATVPLRRRMGEYCP